MKRRVLQAMRKRYKDAQRKGHYAKAAYIKRYLKTVQALSREVRNASA